MSRNCSLKPGKGLERRTELKSRAPLKRKQAFDRAEPPARNREPRGKPLAPVRKNNSLTQKVREAKYASAKRQFLTQHPFCAFPDCTAPADDIHHSRGKAGDLLWDERWFIPACRCHHDDCHRATGERRKRYVKIGWIRTRHRGGELDESEAES